MLMIFYRYDGDDHGDEDAAATSDDDDAGAAAAADDDDDDDSYIVVTRTVHAMTYFTIGNPSLVSLTCELNNTRNM